MTAKTQRSAGFEEMDWEFEKYRVEMPLRLSVFAVNKSVIEMWNG